MSRLASFFGSNLFFKSRAFARCNATPQIFRHPLCSTARCKSNDAEGFVFLGTTKHGQSRPGVDDGPLCLIKGFNFPPMVQIVYPLAGMVRPPQGSELVKVSTNPNAHIRDAKVVGESNYLLHQSIVRQSLKYLSLNQGCRWPSILTLGGDHSLGIGSVSGVAALCEKALSAGFKRLPFSNPELVLIWVDAHADINTPSSTLSGNLHGCPVSRLVGLEPSGWRELRHFDWATNNERGFVKVEHLAYIGVRDLDDAEKDFVKDRNIISYDMKAVKATGRDMQRIVRDCVDRADPDRTRPIHLSVDIDSIDPRFAPSTGTPVADGLHPDECKKIIEGLKSTGRLVSMDLVEVNPSLGTVDEVNLTVSTARKLMETFYV